MPEISIIVPVYNVAKYLHRCIDSIMAQTYSDFELILIDDGSTDSSGSICEEYAEKDARIQVFHQRNQGQGAARNFALDWIYANSDSVWISFIDSDDWVHPRMLEALYLGAVKYQKKISVCNWIDTDREISLDTSLKLEAKVCSTEKLYCSKPTLGVVPWAKLYHRECFQNMRYPLVRACEDEFVTYKVLFRYNKLAVVDAPMYAYFLRDNSTMRSSWSPEKLVKITAQEEQLRFFETKGYKSAYSYTVRAYLQNFIDQIRDIQQCNNKIPKKNLDFLRRKLRNALIVYRSAYPFREHKWMYEVAYPRCMSFYWKIEAICNKLGRR